jgi:TctA family transporter
MMRTDVLGTVLLNLIGLGLLVAGWATVSGKTRLADQMPSLNLAVAGIVIVGIGNALYLMNQRRTVEARMRRVRDRLSPGDVGP